MEGEFAYLVDDLDTDQIAPANMMRSLTPDYERGLFGNRRKSALEKGDPLGFDLPQYVNAPILVTGKNFGCGSAREVAVWALCARGIRCIISPSFAPVFRESCLKNGLLPVELLTDCHASLAQVCLADAGRNEFTVDIRARTLTCPDGTHFSFAFNDEERDCLMHGIDDVASTMRYSDDIAAWEKRCARLTPWLQQDMFANISDDDHCLTPITRAN